MREVWAFVDLDGTLVRSMRRYPEMDGTHGYVDLAGRARGVVPRSAARLLTLLETADRVIPVTDRDVAALGRVALEFTDVAVCCRAGVVLRPDGAADPDYRAHMSALLAPHAAAFAELAARLEDLPVRLRRVGHEGVEMYLVARDLERDEARITALDLPRLTPPGWHVHQKHDQISFAPPPLTKEAGVAWLLREGRPSLVIGAGDASPDAEFLKLCDFAVVPGDSLLAAHW